MKYKLIKEYPGSGKLGKILTNECEGIENYPEFWQEIKEYPKIISFRTIGDTEHSICSLNYDKTYGNGHHLLSSMLHDQPCVDSGDFEIYKVAKSETEVFTIGDKFTFKGLGGVNWMIKSDVIQGFYYYNENIRVKYHNGGIDINKIIKTKDCLFITEDGVEIFEGNHFVWVTEDWDILGDLACASSGKRKENKYFSNKGTAEKYINENKPMFSKKQIKDILKEKGFIGTDVLKQKLGI